MFRLAPLVCRYLFYAGLVLAAACSKENNINVGGDEDQSPNNGSGGTGSGGEFGEATGGSGGEQPESDTLAPSLVESTPLSGAKETPLETSIILKFSEEIVATSEQVSLISDGEALEGNVRVDGDTLEFTPSSPLSLHTDYELVVDRDVRDRAGNTLKNALSISFTTRDGSWENAKLLTDKSAGDVSFFRVSPGPNGTALAVWQAEESTSRLYASSMDENGMWSDTIALSPDDESVAYHGHAFDVSPQGLAVVAWVGGGKIRARTYQFGLGWSSTQDLKDASTDGLIGNARCDHVGGAVVSYLAPDGSNVGMHVSRFNGRDWREPEVVQQALGFTDATKPWAVLSPEGGVVALWIETTEVWANVALGGGEFGGATQLQPPEAGIAVWGATAAFEGEDNAYAAWRFSDSATSSQSAVVSEYVRGTGWSTGTKIARPAAIMVDQVETVADGRGGRILSWYSSTNSEQWSYRFDGGLWSSAQRLDDSRVNRPTHQILGMDPTGNALVGWMDSLEDRVSVRRWRKGDGWLATDHIAGVADPDPGMYLNVAQDGRAWLSWTVAHEGYYTRFQ